jgi:hypothetical protein
MEPASPAGDERLILRRTMGVVAILALAGACGSSGRESVLSADERALVDTYVRIIVLDAWRSDAPDSVGPALDRLAHTYDSTAVRAALRGLEVRPDRWQHVYEAIADRLHALEREVTPEGALRALERGEITSADSAAGPATHPATPRSP